MDMYFENKIYVNFKPFGGLLLISDEEYLTRFKSYPVQGPCSFEDEEDGKSGNRKLGMNCSYCAFKHTCWPGVQTIPYAQGPRYLTKIVRPPVLRGKRDKS